MTSGDSRLRRYVVTIVHHTIFAGEMFRMGAVTTVLPGKQTQDRVWFYGMRMVAHYVHLSIPVRVHVSSVKAWNASDQRQRVKALSITTQQAKTMPLTGLSLRSRYKDANKAAMEVAISKRPLEQEQELREQDRKYNRVAPVAAQRVKYLIDSPDHFIHAQKASGKEQRQKTRDEKKAPLYLEISITGKEEGHQWVPKGRGLQCHEGCNATGANAEFTNTCPSSSSAMPRRRSLSWLKACP